MSGFWKIYKSKVGFPGKNRTSYRIKSDIKDKEITGMKRLGLLWVFFVYVFFPQKSNDQLPKLLRNSFWYIVITHWKLILKKWKSINESYLLSCWHHTGSVSGSVKSPSYNMCNVSKMKMRHQDTPKKYSKNVKYSSSVRLKGFV